MQGHVSRRSRAPVFGPYTRDLTSTVPRPTSPAPAPAAPERLLELDWLRAFAVLWVVLYHCVIVFVGSGWVVNDGQTRERLGQAFELVGNWRMPMLFLIAGAAVEVAMRRYDTRRFLRERAKRLLVPLAAGLVLLVPVQAYLDVNRDHGAREGFPSFLAHFWTASVHDGRVAWYHLWFLAFLCVFTVATLPLLLAAQRPAGSRVLDAVRRHLVGDGRILYLGLVLAVLHALPDDLGRAGPLNVIGDAKLLAVYGAPFLFGWVLAGSTELWRQLEVHRAAALRMALLATPALYLARATYWSAVARGDASSALLFGVSTDLLDGMATWCSIVAPLGYGIRYLRRQHPAIRYLRSASYPVYLLHQPVVVVLATGIVAWRIPTALKFGVLTAGTVALTALLYEMVRRTRPGRLLFGIAEPRRAVAEVGGEAAAAVRRAAA